MAKSRKGVRAIRTLISPQTNGGKIEQLTKLHAAYVGYLRLCVERMLEARRWSVPLREMMSFFPRPANGLTCHFEKDAKRQAVVIVSSWVKSLYPNVMCEKIVEAGVLTDDQRRQLCTIGKHTIAKPCSTRGGQISQEMVDLYWWCVWEPEVTGRRPTPHDDCPMVLDEAVIRLETNEKSESFDLWLSCSSLVPRQRLLLPLSPHPELPTRDVLARDPKALGRLQLAKTVSVRRDAHGRWWCQLTDRRPQTKPEVVEGRKLGIDAGLNVIAATSDGRLLGRQLKPQFDRLRSKIFFARRMRQQQGFDKDSPRLRAMEEQLTGLVATSVGRVVNLLLHLYPGSLFVIEQMDLRGAPGSKRFAYRKLLELFLRRAVVLLVNAAYNSQECPCCHHVAAGNRHGTLFLCQNCGYRSHADIVGARNALGRSEDKRITLESHRSAIRAILRAQYLALRAGPSAAGCSPSRPTVGPHAHRDLRAA